MFLWVLAARGPRPRDWPTEQDLPPQLTSLFLTHPEGATSSGCPLSWTTPPPCSLYKHNHLLDPSGNTGKGASCLTLGLARALHTSEKVMDGVSPQLSCMPGKGSCLPGFFKAQVPGNPNPWPSPQLPSQKLGSGITVTLPLVSSFSQLQLHLRDTFSLQLFHPGTLRGSTG